MLAPGGRSKANLYLHPLSLRWGRGRG
jgi:hypothetical protein